MRITEKQKILIGYLESGASTKIIEVAHSLGWPEDSVKKVATALQKKGFIKVFYAARKDSKLVEPSELKILK